MNVGMGTTPSTVTVEVQRSATETGNVETLMVEVNTKPFVSLIWSGTVVMMVGFAFSIMRGQRSHNGSK
jgi:cytochrome c biogenesis factor